MTFGGNKDIISPRFQNQNPTKKASNLEKSPQRKIYKVSDSNALRTSSMLHTSHQNIGRFNHTNQPQLRGSFNQSSVTHNKLSLSNLQSSQLLRKSQNVLTKGRQLINTHKLSSSIL
jgi:hypothetical protein